jgi:precorrin-2 dehydrogenase / sirohydrochlorin ferrochelatase
MLPVSVDLARISVILVGAGAAAGRRLALLDEAGAASLAVYAPEAGTALAEAAGIRLRRRWPRRAEIGRARLVFLAGVPDPPAAAIVAAAQRSGALVNVEDDARRSDFHSASVLRRGDLTVAVSTNGKSPGLAAVMRRLLERLIGPEWGSQTDEIAALRRSWRSAGADAAAIGRWTEAWVARHG